MSSILYIIINVVHIVHKMFAVLGDLTQDVLHNFTFGSNDNLCQCLHSSVSEPLDCYFC